MDAQKNRPLRLFQIMDRLRRLWTETTPCSQLSKSQFGTLLTLHHGEDPRFCSPSAKLGRPMTLSELAAAMKQTMPAVSQRIAKLETMGYVLRSQDSHDKRTVWISLTPEGIHLMDAAYTDMMNRLEAMMTPLTESETEMLFTLLGKLSDGMEAQLAARHSPQE